MKKRLISLFIAFSMIAAATSPVMAGDTVPEDSQSTESAAGQDGQSTESATGQDSQSTESAAGQDSQSTKSAADLDAFEAAKSGVIFTIPDEFKDIKGMIDFTDFGDTGSEGQGCVQMAVSYYPMGGEEWKGLMAAKETAEDDFDMEASNKIIGQLNGKELFSVYGLDGNRGVDDLISLLMAELESLKEFYPEEEFEKMVGSEKKWISSARYDVLGTKGGFTYILKSNDPEELKNIDPFPGYEDGYYDEYISLTENTDLIEKNLELTGNVKLTVPFEFASEGKRIEFETTDLDGNPVKSEDLFAGHPVTAINLWATWCGPCKEELPDLKTLNAELEENDCQIIGIVTDATKDRKIEKAKEILKNAGTDYVNLVPFEALSEMLPQNCWPTTYFVDENGILVGEPVDSADPDMYRETIAELLGEKAQLTEGEAQMPESEAQLTDSEVQMPESDAQLTDSEAQMSESDAQLTDSEAQLTESEEQTADSETGLSGSEAGFVESEDGLPGSEAGFVESEAGLPEGENGLAETETRLSEDRPRMVGGWNIVPHEAEELPEDAQAAFDKATEDLDGAEYTPVALMATQVVAGMNYCILCQITPVVPDAEPTWALVYIYADLQGNAEIMNVYELYIAQHSTPKPQQ